MFYTAQGTAAIRQFRTIPKLRNQRIPRPDASWKATLAPEMQCVREHTVNMQSANNQGNLPQPCSRCIWIGFCRDNVSFPTCAQFCGQNLFTRSALHPQHILSSQKLPPAAGVSRSGSVQTILPTPPGRHSVWTQPPHTQRPLRLRPARSSSPASAAPGRDALTQSGTHDQNAACAKEI